MEPLSTTRTQGPFVIQEQIIRTSICITAITTFLVICCLFAFSFSGFVCWLATSLHCTFLCGPSHSFSFGFCTTFLRSFLFFGFLELDLERRTGCNYCRPRFALSSWLLTDSVCDWKRSNCFRCHRNSVLHFRTMLTLCKTTHGQLRVY